MAAKREATLGDVIEALQKQNQLIEGQTKKQEKTDKAIEHLAEVMADYVADSRLQTLFTKSEEKSQSKRPPKIDRSFFVSDLIRGDILGALLGAGSALAVSVASFLGLFKFSSSLSAMFNPETYKKFDRSFTDFFARVSAFFIGAEKTVKIVESGFLALTRMQNFFGRAFAFIGNQIQTIDRIIQRYIRFSPGNILSGISALGNLFKAILLIDVGIKSIGGAIREFQSTKNIFKSILEGVKIVLQEAVAIGADIINSIYKIIRFVGKKLFQWTGLDKFFIGLNERIKSDFGINIGAVFTAIDNNFIRIVNLFRDFLVEFVDVYIDWFKTAFTMENFKSIKDYITSSWDSMIDGVQAGIEGFVSFVGSKMKAGIEAIKNAFQSILDLFNDIASSLNKLTKGPREFLKNLKMPDLNPFDNKKEREELARSDQRLTVRADDMERQVQQKRAMERNGSNQVVTVVNAPATSNTTAIRQGDLINMPSMNPANPFDPAFLMAPAY